jgi:hypothetical protein
MGKKIGIVVMNGVINKIAGEESVIGAIPNVLRMVDNEKQYQAFFDGYQYGKQVATNKGEQIVK